jgi:hydroxypyruvate reductase
MTRAAAQVLTGFHTALVITKRQVFDPAPRMTIMEGGHPLPDFRSLAAGEAALSFVSHLREDDLLVCLISGGGSALATVPKAGISLADLRELTSAAMKAGADIEELNTLRSHLDALKAGGLVRATRATIIGLILSDVVGDRLDAVASGPTAAISGRGDDPTAVLRRLGIRPPAGVVRALASSFRSHGATPLASVRNVVVGNLSLALHAAEAQAESEGFHCESLGPNLLGEARDAGRALGSMLAEASRHRARPFCILTGGETTVTITASGLGGRNQELALASVDTLDSTDHCILIGLATDGEDGPTDAAGAVVTSTSRSRASRLGLQASDHLGRHDAYSFFRALGDLLKPGITGTNVNDLVFLLGL